MPAARVAMRKIREVLRLHHVCGLSKRKIAPLVGLGPTAVGDYIRRAREAGFDWPLPADVDDEVLERRPLLSGQLTCWHRECRSLVRFLGGNWVVSI